MECLIQSGCHVFFALSQASAVRTMDYEVVSMAKYRPMNLLFPTLKQYHDPLRFPRLTALPIWPPALRARPAKIHPCS